MKYLISMALLLSIGCNKKLTDQAEDAGDKAPAGVTDGPVAIANGDGVVRLYYPSDEQLAIPDGADLAKFRAKIVDAYHELDIDVTFTGNSWFAEQVDESVEFCKDPFNLEHNSLCAKYYTSNKCK